MVKQNAVATGFEFNSNMGTERHHPSNAEIAREERLGICTGLFGCGSRPSKPSHDIEAAAGFLDKVRPADLIVVESEPSIACRRRERAGSESRALLTIEELDLAVGIQADVTGDGETRAITRSIALSLAVSVTLPPNR